MTFSKHAAIVGLFMFFAPLAVAEESPLDRAWARVVASQPEGEEPGEEGRAVRHWFLGFVEGKTGVEPPEFWREVVLTCKIDRASMLYFLMGDFESPYHWTKDEIECPRDTDVVLGESSVEVKVGEESIVFTDEEIVREIKQTEGLSTAWTKDRVYLALQGGGTAFPLVAVDRSTKQSRWTAEVEPIRKDTIFLSGQGVHFVKVVLHEGDVYVFGASNLSAYVTRFDAESGKVDWRFTTWVNLEEQAKKQEEENSIAEIVALIDDLPDWPLAPVTGEGLTEEKEADAKEIERIAAKIAMYDLDMVRVAFAQVETTHEDERLFWLNKYLFAIPSRLPANSPHIGMNFNAGWAGSLPFENIETANQNGASIWPWVEAEDGTLRFSRDVNGVTYEGPPYQAERAFNFYRTTFGPRRSSTPATSSKTTEAEVEEILDKLKAMNPKWKLDRLAKEAEVILIGTLDLTVEQPEADYRDDPALDDSCRSVDSHFKVLGVLRGEQIGETVTVAHLAWPPDTANLSPMKLFEFYKEIRIPALVGIHVEGNPLTLSAGNLLKDDKQATDTVVPRYLLFLKRDDQGRLVPVSGQAYAAMSAMTLNFHEGY